MKFEKNPKYNTYALLALIVVGFAALLISLTVHAESLWGAVVQISSVFSPIFYAFILMLVLMPIMDFFVRQYRKLLCKKKKREKLVSTLALVTSYLVLLAVVALAVGIIIPQFKTLFDFLRLQDSAAFLGALDTVASGAGAGEGLGGILGDLLASLVRGAREMLTDAFKQLPTLVTKIADAFGNVVSRVSNWVLALIISVYAMLRRDYLKAVAAKINAALFKPETADRIAGVCRELYANTGYFFSARAYNSLAVAVVFFFVLWAMGLKFHSVLCLLIAICSFVPVFGMLIGGALGTLIVLVTDTRLAGWFLLVFLVLMILDYMLLRPRIVNKKVQVSLGTTMICVLVGYFVWNALGALFAVPFYVTVRDLFIAWSKKKAKE